MRPGDFARAWVMHHTARFTVRYGEDLRFAGRDLPPPTKRRFATRHGTVRAFEYGGEDGPAYVHFHGGAWLMRYPQMDDWWCRYIAATTGLRVVNVDFSAAPYVTYPVAQEQCHDVAAAVATGPPETPVVIGGFSSGGGTAAAVALMARDTGSFTPRLQVLGVPVLDLASDVTGSGMISTGLRGLVRRVYFPDKARRAEPYASPLLAEDLSGLPRALVLTAERDSLRPDGDAYAARLAAAGVEVWHDVSPGVDHYFLTEDPTRARSTMARISDEIRRL